MSLHKLNTGDPVEITVQQFFSDICPKILEANKEACAKLGGYYGFQIFGEGGGNWTLDYTKSEVRDSLDEKLDLYLEMDAADFLGLMKGTLDIEASAKEGKIRFEGDPRLFNNLAAVMQPAEA
jgi:putative sterol carrier protein